MPLAERARHCAPTLKASRCILPTLLSRILITRRSRSMTWEGLCSGSRIPIVRSRFFRYGLLSRLVPTTPLMGVLLPSRGFYDYLWPQDDLPPHLNEKTRTYHPPS